MSKRIITLGDSTMQFNNFTRFPQTGWPQALVRFLNPQVSVLNFAVNGKSTKNYISLGLFDNALANINKDDLVLIEFGHNDLKAADPSRFTEPYGEYQQNLEFMIQKCLEKGAEVFLLTSICERLFENEKLLDSPHLEYTKAMKQVAERLQVPCIDLYALTKEQVQQAGAEGSKRFYMNFPAGLYSSHIEGLEDNTHLRYDGAFMVAECFYKEMHKMNLFNDLFLNLE